MKNKTEVPNVRHPVPIVRPRIRLTETLAIGPGKIDLLRQVAETQSISGAARALGMTYKRAWFLIDSLNQGLGRPVVETATGGKGGGGALLTDLGRQVVERYMALETCLNAAGRKELNALRRLTK